VLGLLGGRGGEGGGDDALFDVPACQIRLYLACCNDSGNNVPHRRSERREVERREERKGKEGEAKQDKARQDRTTLDWSGLGRGERTRAKLGKSNQVKGK